MYDNQIYKCEIDSIADIIENKIKEYNDSKIFGRYYKNIERYYLEKDNCMVYDAKYHIQNNIFDINPNYKGTDYEYIPKYSKKYFHNGREIEIPVFMRKIKESGERVVGELSTKAMLKQIMLRDKIRQIDIRIDKQANSRESQA